MSDSVQPHRRQPTRLPHPWDSPGKNTGVGCHFLLQCMKVKVKLLSRVQLFTTPWTVAYQAPPSMGFSRQEYWSGVPLPSLYILLDNPILCIWKHVCVCVRACETVTKSCLTPCDPWTAAHQAPPSMGFSRQEYWDEVPLPSLFLHC